MRFILSFGLIFALAVGAFAADEWEDQGGHYNMALKTQATVTDNILIDEGPDLKLEYKPDIGQGNGNMGSSQSDTLSDWSHAHDGASDAKTYTVCDIRWTDIDGSTTNAFLEAETNIRVDAIAIDNDPDKIAAGLGSASARGWRSVKNTGGQDQIFHGKVEFTNAWTILVEGGQDPTRSITMRAEVGSSVAQVQYVPTNDEDERWKLTVSTPDSSGDNYDTDITYYEICPTFPIDLYHEAVNNEIVKCVTSVTLVDDPRNNSLWQGMNRIYIITRNKAGFDDERDDIWKNRVRLTLLETIDEN